MGFAEYKSAPAPPLLPIADGFFSLQSAPNDTFFLAHSNILLPSYINMDNVTWRWEQVEGPIAVSFYDLIAYHPTQAYAEDQGVSGDYNLWWVWVNFETFIQGNFHFRFTMSYSGTEYKSKCRAATTFAPNYDSQWDDVNYEPSWVQGTSYMAASGEFNRLGQI